MTVCTPPGDGVHPKDEFDGTLVGGGPAGENSAGRCAETRLSVTLVWHD